MKDISVAYALLTFLLACATTAVSQTVTVLYNFGDQLSHDGNFPNGTLTLDNHGTLYGTTAQGGPGNTGIVFALVPPSVAGGTWTERAIFANFSGPNGLNVNGGLVLNQQSGKLYGTTRRGGSRDVGVIFELAPPKQSGAQWTETVLYNFTGTEGGTDGGLPAPGLIADSRGALYGTTQSGGQHQNGTVFRLSPPSHPGGAWNEKILHSFEGRGDGAMPISGLVIDEARVLYGVTPFAGANRSGAVFKVSPPASGTGAWTESVIYSFTGAHDGSLPDGRFPETALIVDHAGNLYGTTNRGGNTCVSGCGTIFRLSPPTAEGGAWTELILHSFASHFDGGSPSGALVLDSQGSLYGASRTGGIHNGGTIFKLTPPVDGSVPWTKTSFSGFPSGTGGSQGALLLVGSKFYGTTPAGGTSQTGTIFEMEQ